MKKIKIIEPFKALDGLFLLDSCVLTYSLHEDAKKVNSFAGFTSLYEICRNQKKLNDCLINNKRVIIIPEVKMELAGFLKKIMENERSLNARLKEKVIRWRRPYKNNKKISKRRYVIKPSEKDKVSSKREKDNQILFSKYFEMINELYFDLEYQVISYEDLSVSKDYFENIEKKIWQIQQKKHISDNEKPGYIGTDEKLITTALILGKNIPVNLMTMSTRIFDTMLALNEEGSDIYSPKELEDVKQRPAVRMFCFDLQFSNIYRTEFPEKNLPKNHPIDIPIRLPHDFSKFR